MAAGTGTPNNVPMTLDTRVSKVSLPIVGGYTAAVGGRDHRRRDGRAGASAPPAGHDRATRRTPTGTKVTYTNPTATDNEDANPVVTCTPASGTKFRVGSTVVTCTAT